VSSLKKNVASQNITFGLINASSGAALTGATVSVYVTKDGGSQASGGGSVTEAGNGQYFYAPTQAETNATDVGFLFTATSAIPVNLDFHTDIVDANGYPSINLVDIAGSAVSTSSAQLGVNLVNIAGSAVSATSAQLGVNVVEYNTQTAQTDGNGFPKVDLVDIAGSAVSTSGAQLGVNLVDIAGSAVSTSSPQLGVNLVDIAGSSVSTSSAQLGVNAVNIAGQAATLDANNLLKVDVEDVNGSATIESGINLLEALRYVAAALAGQLSGAATTTITIKAINNSGTTRITATVDANGDRSAITLS